MVTVVEKKGKNEGYVWEWVKKWRGLAGGGIKGGMIGSGDIYWGEWS